MGQVLFSSGRLDDWLADRVKQLGAAVDAIPQVDLLGRDADDLAADLVALHRVEPIELGEPEIEERGEAQVDVSWDPRRFIDDRSSPFYVDGWRVEVHVPVLAGEKAIFQLAPNRRTYSPPEATVEAGSIVRTLLFPNGREQEVGPGVASFSNTLIQWVDFGRPQIDEFNQALPTRARGLIEARRSRILARKDALAKSGIPVRQRPDAPRTYQAPGITRTQAPTLPTPSHKPAAPLEPVMVDEFYEHVLAVIRSGARGIERARGSFVGMGEEDLRHHFLFTLNTHYAGAATGEAFNAEGKTDILVRVADRNVFIGECKFWKGRSGFSETVDQLFGYTTWHDTKAALIIFVRQKGLTGVVDKARSALAEHGDFIGWQDAPEGELRCEMAWPGDPDRKVDLAVIFVHLADVGPATEA